MKLIIIGGSGMTGNEFPKFTDEIVLLDSTMIDVRNLGNVANTLLKKLSAVNPVKAGMRSMEVLIPAIRLMEASIWRDTGS